MLETYPTSPKYKIGSGIKREDDFSRAVTVRVDGVYGIGTKIYRRVVRVTYQWRCRVLWLSNCALRRCPKKPQSFPGPVNQSQRSRFGYVEGSDDRLTLQLYPVSSSPLRLVLSLNCVKSYISTTTRKKKIQYIDTGDSCTCRDLSMLNLGSHKEKPIRECVGDRWET
jgi:hypothetical protein